MASASPVASENVATNEQISPGDAQQQARAQNWQDAPSLLLGPGGAAPTHSAAGATGDAGDDEADPDSEAAEAPEGWENPSGLETAMSADVFYGYRGEPKNPCDIAFQDTQYACPPPGFPDPFFSSSPGYGGGGEQGSAAIDPARTMVELRMCMLSAAIREKPDWRKKKDDPEIRAKWKQEALQLPEGVREEWRLTPTMVDYVLEELDGWAKLRDEATGIEPACYERVWKSDSLIEPSLASEVLEVAARLENVPDDAKDWHPGSDGKVLNLVHPSLYPVVYGESLQRESPGSANMTVIPAPDSESFRSARFAWLPSEFEVSESGSVRLTSPYINNLHPEEHQSAYQVIEKVVERAVPLWERVLSDLRRPATNLRMVTTPCNDNEYVGMQMDIGCIWPNGIPWPQDEKTGEDASDDWDEEEWEAFRAKQPKRLPEALPKYTGFLDAIKVTESLKGKTLQVIVKLANIVLTPEKPDYDGGAWHVEAMKNEQIVSTFIYYYDESNITESRLAFRTAIAEPVYHEQDDTACTRILWNLDRDDICVQDLGSVVTKAGRCIAFPNTYQHQIQPFKLADPSKPGHRKIVALFLVDPGRPVLSATTVAPGQRHWYARAADTTARMAKLPVELRDLIFDAGVAGTMSKEEAEAARLELMQERTAGGSLHSGMQYGTTFNLCEH